MSAMIGGREGERTEIPAVPGLHVTIARAVASRERRRGRVRLIVRGGTAPVRLYLYVDGELAEAWIPTATVCEYATDSLAPGRHALTARAIDAEGRWGGTTVIVDGVRMPAPSALIVPTVSGPVAPDMR